MGIVLDGIIIILVFAGIVSGIKRGLVKSLLGFLGYLAALILAAMLANALSEAIYTYFLRDALVERISAGLEASVAGDAVAQAKEILDGLPGILQNALQNSGITPETLTETLSGAAETAAENTADLIAPVMTNLLRLFCMPILFAVVLFLVRILVKMVSNVFRLPGLRQVDSLLGGVFGFFSGVVWAMLLTMMLQLCLPLVGQDTAKGLQQAIDQSYTAQILSQYDPVQKLLGNGESPS